MSDRPNKFEGEDEQTNDLAPELHNAEQDDAQYQTQTLANEALGRSSDDFGLDDTEKVPTGEEGDDVQDIVDHMRQMVSSGRIDNSAYAGEPNDDDNDDLYLPAIEPDDPGAVGSDGE